MKLLLNLWVSQGISHLFIIKTGDTLHINYEWDFESYSQLTPSKQETVFMTESLNHSVNQLIYSTNTKTKSFTTTTTIYIYIFCSFFSGTKHLKFFSVVLKKLYIAKINKNNNLDIYSIHFLPRRNMMMDMERPTMTRDMTRMTTTTAIRRWSKFVCVLCAVSVKGISECLCVSIWTRELIHNVGQCSPLCIEPKSLCRSAQSWTWRFAVLEIVQANVGGSFESPKERSEPSR